MMPDEPRQPTRVVVSAWRRSGSWATIMRIQIIFYVALILALLGCRTSQSQRREQFLISHGFQREKDDFFSRHYSSLTAASRDLGFPIDRLWIPPNGPRPDAEDTRIADLHGWSFVVTADKGGTLDDSSTPCTVGMALVQVSTEKNSTKGFR